MRGGILLGLALTVLVLAIVLAGIVIALVAP
jgi:hypothetical protein